MSKVLRLIAAGSVPLVFGIGFVQLGSVFDYPNILRQPSLSVLTRFHEHQAEILPWWWLMFVAALAFVPVSVLVAEWVGLKGSARSAANAVGITAGIVQALGLSRWVFAVPVLAERVADPDQSKQALMLFDLMHQWFGVGLGEWAGYLFTAIWTAIVATSVFSKSRWFSIVGLVISLGIAAGLLEVFGLSIAGAINAVSYSLWVLWMVGLAVMLARTAPLSQTKTEL